MGYKDMIGRVLIRGRKMVSENKRKCFPYFWKFLEKAFLWEGLKRKFLSFPTSGNFQISKVLVDWRVQRVVLLR